MSDNDPSRIGCGSQDIEVVKSPNPGGHGILKVEIGQKIPIGQAAEELLLIWAATEAEEWKNQICVLPL